MQIRWIKNLTCLLTLALLLSLTGFAQGNVNQRQREQQQRIRQGVRSGELTRVEAARLQSEQARIRAAEARARRSGGVFTTRERAHIQRELNQSSRNIYQQKRDRQDRW